MPFFDYPKIAREAGIPEDKLRALVESVRAEWGSDEMMADLHILRACKAIRDGRVKLDEVLDELKVEAR